MESDSTVTALCGMGLGDWVPVKGDSSSFFCGQGVNGGGCS